MPQLSPSPPASAIWKDKQSIASINMPTPTTPSKISATETADATITLLTVDGKQLRSTSQKLNKGTNAFYINDLEALQKGIYFLQVQYGDEMKSIKLLKVE